MKNIITGWVTSIFGLIIMIAAGLDFFNIIQVPAPTGMTELEQITTAFITGAVLFLVPASKLELALSKVVDKKANNKTNDTP